MKVKRQQDVRLLRRAAYPPIEDLADAIVKDDAEALETYRARCLAVKTKYPKSTKET